MAYPWQLRVRTIDDLRREQEAEESKALLSDEMYKRIGNRLLSYLLLPAVIGAGYFVYAGETKFFEDINSVGGLPALLIMIFSMLCIAAARESESEGSGQY